MTKYLDLAETIPFDVTNTIISREDFEAHFTRTKEKVTFTFQGWDGKSYDGESRTANVYRTDIPEMKDNRFVKVGKSIHCIVEDSKVLEKATGEYHPTVYWCAIVDRKAQ